MKGFDTQKHYHSTLKHVYISTRSIEMAARLKSSLATFPRSARLLLFCDLHDGRWADLKIFARLQKVGLRKRWEDIG